MPNLDVSDLLTDPDFADKFDVLRTTESVSSGGMVQQSVQTISSVIGVVTPMSDRELSRLPDAERLTGQVMVYTKFRLSDGEGNRTADIVRWADEEYTVVSTDNYSRFGAGFIAARCVLKPVSP